ncbi:MAG: hypothetical protein J6U96_00385, partial [Elusimicrobiaceae bacterium]|nr:hypothetical protein [Elusimicrobiaceae bacterium]
DSMKGGRSAKYTNGYRDARAGYGAQSAEGKDLRDIAVHSGKVAANKDRSSNEGASPFLATKYFSGSLDPIGSGSEGLITDPSLQGIANDSFGDKMEIKLDDLDQKLDEVDTTEQERQAQEKRFTNWVSILAVASIGAMFAIAALKQEPPWGTVAAAAISAVMTGLWIWFDVALKKDYIDKFGSDAMSTIYFILSGLCLGGMMAAWVWGGFSNMLNQIAAWFAKVFHISLGGIGASSVLGAGVDGATKLAKKE